MIKGKEVLEKLNLFSYNRKNGISENGISALQKPIHKVSWKYLIVIQSRGKQIQQLRKRKDHTKQNILWNNGSCKFSLQSKTQTRIAAI